MSRSDPFLSFARLSKSRALFPGDHVSLVDLIKNRFIDDRDILRAHCLLQKSRGVLPAWYAKPRNKVEEGMSMSTFTCGINIIKFSMYESPEGPMLIILDITDARAVQQFFITNERWRAMCSVCKTPIVPYDSQMQPMDEYLDDAMARCVCNLTQYCGRECQVQDWKHLGHKHVHQAMMVRNADLD